MNDRHLASFVQPNLTEARIARQWQDVDPRSLARRLPRHFVPAVAMLVSCAALMGVVARRSPRPSLLSLEGAVIERGAITLADGSRMAVAEGGHVRVVAVREDTVELALDVGTIALAVPHGRRTLVVHTPRYDVVDLGTQFRVDLDTNGDVHVDVSEGSVEVRGRDGQPARRLDAGESWSTARPVASPPPAPATTPPATDPPTSPAAPAVSDRDVSTGPRDLLETAERARMAGHPRAAAVAFDTLRRRFRTDPRAALAAFELGRLRLDSLGDAPGALEALNDAIALSPRGPLREDAEARRVEALAAQHSPDCGAARDAFLARYPRSAHADLVSGRCAAE